MNYKTEFRDVQAPIFEVEEEDLQSELLSMRGSREVSNLLGHNLSSFGQNHSKDSRRREELSYHEGAGGTINMEEILGRTEDRRLIHEVQEETSSWGGEDNSEEQKLILPGRETLNAPTTQHNSV